MKRSIAMALYWTLLLVSRFHPLPGRGRNRAILPRQA